MPQKGSTTNIEFPTKWHGQHAATKSQSYIVDHICPFVGEYISGRGTEYPKKCLKFQLS